jgi:hypothetical protein
MAEPKDTAGTRSVRAMCPTCGRFPKDTHLAVDGSIITATFLCPASHSWLSKWSQVAS